MEGDYDIANQPAQRSDNGDAALAVMVMDEVAGEGSGKIAEKGGQKEQ